MQLVEAERIALKLCSDLAPIFERLEVAGSVRRCKPEVKDIELVGIPKFVDQPSLIKTPGFIPVIPSTELNNWSQMGRIIKAGQRYKQIELFAGINLDLFIVLPPAQWGVIMAIRTGPAEFSKWLVTARRYGGALPGHLKVRDGSLWQGNRMIETSEEDDFFREIGLNDWELLEPAQRKPLW